MEQPKFIENQNGRACMNLQGQRSGKLVAVSPCDPPEGRTGKARNQWWLCSCDCGGEHRVSATVFRRGEVTRCPDCRK